MSKTISLKQGMDKLFYDTKKLQDDAKSAVETKYDEETEKPMWKDGA